MVWLLALPIWCVFWSYFLKKSLYFKLNDKSYTIICSLALIFVVGLRSRYCGSMDTVMYSRLFNSARNYTELADFMRYQEVTDNPLILSEAGFYVCIWVIAQLFSDPQWLILISSAFIIFATAKFILRHSDDPLISWLVFICLGSMTFAMNGMRQALAMSICLLSYRYVNEKKPIRFFFVVLVAVLFHKSSIIFLAVYFMRNMKLNKKSFAFLLVGVTAFLLFAQRFAFLYDSFAGEDYTDQESFESGGVVIVLIYAIAIIGTLIQNKRLKDSRQFLPLALIVFGVALYLGRFVSTQIYERISYYFAYFLMLCFPAVLKDPDPKTRLLLRTGFVILCFSLFAYRIYKGAFSDFEMFWQEATI